MTWGAVELEPEVEKWLESLPTAQFAHAAFYVDLLAEQGPLLGEPYTKQLDRKLRELRFHLERRAVRITYWIATGRRIILLTVSARRACGKSGRSTGRAERWRGVSTRRMRLWTRRRGHERKWRLGRYAGAADG
ncbi:type II toxin-antitoxin system RelE/ParE family toxin [Actinoplanes sp. GCM10030250]|uniref:type II toxin-antitoxin system RelE/ParE family toxin n=1 Tax=Actinoplanes sp. GCM10030250 TaxID=3273376 RepID=UPI00360C5B0D